MAAPIKGVIKRLVHDWGVLGLHQRARHRETLTALMFHRVLPREDPRFEGSDPNYTLELKVFEELVTYLRARYSPVSLEQVALAAAGKSALPRHALLMTFDDGWEDTARYAIPVLMAAQIPCVVFVPSEALQRPLLLWEDAASSLARLGGAPAGLAEKLAALPPEAREARLEKLVAPFGKRIMPMLMDQVILRGLPQDWVEICAHGASHAPFSKMTDPDAEFRLSARDLAAALGRPVRGFSFPHGNYAPSHLATPQEAGFSLLFTSDHCLNRAPGGYLPSPVLGRIAIGTPDVTENGGRFKPHRAGFWLMSRPSRTLDPDRGSYGP